LKSQTNFHTLITSVDTWLVATLDPYMDDLHANVSKTLKDPWIKKHMETNLTKLYYKHLESYGVTLGGFVEVQNTFFVAKRVEKPAPNKTGQPRLRHFKPGDKFLMLQISIEYEQESNYPIIWLTILQDEQLVKLDAFDMTRRVKEKSVKELS